MPTKVPPELGLGFGQNNDTLPPPDERDKLFRMATLLGEPVEQKEYRYWWSNGWWGNQLSTPQCVAYTGLHLLEDGPITHDPTRKAGVGPVLNPFLLYKECQRVDEWAGEDYAGTSVRALMKVLQSKGLIGEYRWAWDLETTIDWLLSRGPVAVGTWWYSNMFYPEADGMIRVHGYKVGGHAYLLNGVNLKRKLIRIKNSWGRGWGRKGHAWISFGDMARLIAEHGEVATALENPQRRGADGVL